MRRRFSVWMVLFLIIGWSVNANAITKPQYAESKNQTLSPPPPDKAQIIFLEPINSLQGSTPVGIFELEGERRKLLAITGGRTKVALLFNPGHHVFMSNLSGIRAHFLEANVEAGKRYYVLVRFIYGYGFQMRPLRTSGPSDYSVISKDFPTWIAETRFVENTAAGEAFFKKIDRSVGKSQAGDWKVWLNKTPEERAELTLNPTDAVSQ